VFIHCCNLQASLASLRAEWSAELAALKTDVAHKRRVAAAALKARQEEEDIKVSALCWHAGSGSPHSINMSRTAGRSSDKIIITTSTSV
jgi:hypothetical protein